MDECNLDRLHTVIQSTQAPEPDDLLIGWVVVAEWVNGNGANRLMKVASEGARSWTVDGYLWHALTKKP